MSIGLYSKSIKPNSFKAEFIKFSYNQIMKVKKLEKKIQREGDKFQEELQNFSNEAVDNPYKVKKATASLLNGSQKIKINFHKGGRKLQQISTNQNYQ